MIKQFVVQPQASEGEWRLVLERAEEALNQEGQTEILLVFPRDHRAIEDWKRRFEAHNEAQRQANGPDCVGCRLWQVSGPIPSEKADASLHVIQIESSVVGEVFSLK